MQAKNAERLRKEWGNKPCRHPKLDKEYMLGTQTGDFICIKCGKVFMSRGEAEEDHKKNFSE